jgi:hypothetical protein
MEQHEATKMGIVMVMSEQKQVCFDDVYMIEGTLHYALIKEYPCFPTELLDWQKPGDTLVRTIRVVQSISEGTPDTQEIETHRSLRAYQVAADISLIMRKAYEKEARLPRVSLACTDQMKADIAGVLLCYLELCVREGSYKEMKRNAYMRRDRRLMGYSRPCIELTARRLSYHH